MKCGRKSVKYFYMPAPEFVLSFIVPLNQTEISYMITGSIASIMYGEPRLTHDIDIVIAIASDEIPKLMNAFPLEKYYCPPEEILQIESRRTHRGHFNIIHHESGCKADFYFLGAEAYQFDAMRRRVKKEFLNEELWIAPPEYVILWKLLFYREGESIKHLGDIRSMLAVSSHKIDHQLLHEYVERFSLSKEWALCMNKPSSN